MKRTVALNLTLPPKGLSPILQTNDAFADACNEIVPFAVQNRCWNNVALHRLCYYEIRKRFPLLGSQMVCNAIKKVCSAYKGLNIARGEAVPKINFRRKGSIHYDKRTYTLKNGMLSLFAIGGRVGCTFQVGKQQAEYLLAGVAKEGELVRRGNKWFFNLVVDLPDTPRIAEGKRLAVDLGENNLATTSTGTIFGGRRLRDIRDRFLSRRRKLQSNGSGSAKRCLKRISGKERRHVKDVNHVVSRAIVAEAVRIGAKEIVFEELTNIRSRIKGNKRMRSRLHRWSWDELQKFVEYKAQAKGMGIVYVNPAYTSQKCSRCSSLGIRQRHRFTCPSCGSYQHSDRNAAINLLKLGESAVSPTALVNVPMVAALAASYKPLPLGSGS